MNANFVKCLLRVDKVPSVARVELIYPDGEASASTLALKQDKNWLRLTYENFIFSSPTVSVKFPRTLTCVRGKGKKAKTKQVVVFTCAKGWKPRRQPGVSIARPLESELQEYTPGGLHA